MNNIEIDFGNDGFKITAELKKDGSNWCVGIDDMLYGYSPYPLKAIAMFKDELRNYNPDDMKEIFPGTKAALDDLKL